MTRTPLLTIALLIAVSAGQVQAQNAEVAQTQNVEVEPITCWWRTSAQAVRVGEPFTVVLTCSVLDTEAARTVPDDSQLDAAVVQLPPFEVMSGTRSEDVATTGRRFFQYDYRIRLVAENLFGADVALPQLQVPYRIESRAGGTTVQGRDLAYALPAISIRVLTTVPDLATDIREAPVETFAEIQQRAFRATLMRTAGIILLVLGALTAAVAVVRARRRGRRVDAAARNRVSDAAILKHARGELADIQRQASSGWTEGLAGRALAAVRVVDAYATGRPVVQRVSDAPATDGELALRARGKSLRVSAAAASDRTLPFTAARYGRTAAVDPARFDEAVEEAIREADRLRAARPWTERLWTR